MTVLDHLSSDLEDYVSAVLRIAYFITFLAVILALALFATGPLPVLSLLVLFAGLTLSFSLRTFHHLSLAASTYIGTLLVAVAVLILDKGLNDHYVFLFLLPVMAASALVTERGTLYTALLTSAVMVGITGVVSGTAEGLSQAFIPLLLCLLIAVMNIAHSHNLLGLVTWAVDIQGKDTQRAEAFFEQREKLADALLRLQHAKSALEQSNARLTETNIKLEQAEQAAIQASLAKSTFMSNMSHELRTPLNVIIGYSSSMLTMPQMFNDVALPIVYHEYVQLIEDSGQYLLTLINDILDLSKIEASKLSLYPETFLLPPLLRGIIATSVGLVKDKPIIVRPDFDDTLPSVYADPTRVRQILLNLMSNAIKFTTSGSVTLGAVFEDNMVRISVTDTGIGIPEHALDQIFDRYQQVGQSTGKPYGGTGLGLDISKQLSLMHGGDLTVTSTVGNGSTFTFTLPLNLNDMVTKLDEKSESISVDEGENSEDTYLNLVVVLLIEPQDALREPIRKLLETQGYYVLVAHGPQQSIEMADALLPSLVILGATLSQADDEDIIQRLRDNPDTASIPIVLCAKTPPAENLPLLTVIDEPITPKAVLAAAQQLLARPESNKRSPL